MLQLSSDPLTAASAGMLWRRFSAHAPAPDALVEIKRRHDDKTILRRRADLPPSFDWQHAEWRPL